ncbi:homoserine dehydrogenase [Clostridium collagenovorans DSM 3089]|uniref:Homoserine dehydrogenase n=2 Tax=Clostridium TaxID=1485 RepID=A0A1M5XYS5_9CLOT|nr:homoserine dehydrogenase [Clostridium collagenovorans DSM 3089]
MVMRKIVISIAGYGVVGKEFLRLIKEKKEDIKNKYNLELVIGKIIGSKCAIFSDEGIDVEELLKLSLGSMGLKEYCCIKNINFSSNCELIGDIFVDCTPTNLESGEPALSYIYEAIEKNMDLFLASKGALVKNYKSINEKVKEKNLNIKFSGATAAALPTLDIGQICLPLTTIKEIKGILNGTSNFILTSMIKNKMGYEETLKLAFNKGICEKNNNLDVSGFDTACKMVLIVNNILGKEVTLDDVEIQGIENVTNEDIKKAIENDSVIKLLGECEVNDNKVKLKVSPKYISNTEQLAKVDYNNKAIVFNTEEAGEIFCSGGASNPRAAAYSILKDILNAY